MQFISFLKRLLNRLRRPNEEPMKKFLIVGLGNVGTEYDETRHNIGFKILDALAANESVSFETKKLGDIAKFNFKGRTFILLKPATYMNLSGKAVKYWMDKEKVPVEHVLVLCDDLNLPFGTIRIKAKGSDGGHNGLGNINLILKTQQYARFRFGISNTFSKGHQRDYVLGVWNEDEQSSLPNRMERAILAIKSFGTAGIKHTMNDFNGT